MTEAPPWEDFKPAATSGPWDDFAPKAQAAGPWDEFKPEPTSNKAADFARRIPSGVQSGTGRTLQGMVRAADIAATPTFIPFMGGLGPGAETINRLNQQMPAVREEFARGRPQRLRESTAYQLGNEIATAAPETFGVDRARDDEFMAQLATAAGEMVPMLAAGAIAGPLGAGAQYAGSAGESQAQEAIAAGREDVADAAFLAAAGLGGLTEAALGVPGRLLAIINKARKAGVNPGKFGQWANRNPVKSGILRVGAEGGAREAGQEWLETVGQNLDASKGSGYDPDRPALQGAARAAALGGVLGGVIGGGAAGVNQVNRNQQAAQLRTARTVRLTADGPEYVVNPETGTTEFAPLENDWLPAPVPQTQDPIPQTPSSPATPPTTAAPAATAKAATPGPSAPIEFSPFDTAGGDPEARTREREDSRSEWQDPLAAKPTPLILWTASTPTDNVPVQGVWDVVDARQLRTSFDAGYDQSLQPRDRTRQASSNQIARLAQGFEPQRAGESATTDMGAPIVDELNQVLSGNGRTSAIRTLYGSENVEQAVGERERSENYRLWLVQNADRWGVDPSRIRGIERPVLVRRVTNFNGLSKPEFARQSNQQQVLGQSEAEMAGSDARLLTENPQLLDALQPNAEGDVLAASNREFLNGFIAGVGGAADLLTKDGGYTPALKRRVQNAVLGSLIGPENRSLLGSLIERGEELGVKTQVNALIALAPRLARLRGTDFQLGDVLERALADLVRFKSGTETLADFLSQQSLLGDEGRTQETDRVLRFMAEAKSAKEVGDALDRYVRGAQNAIADAQSGGMFGGTPATRADVIQNIYGRQAQSSSTQTGLTLGESSPAYRTGQGDTPATPDSGSVQPPAGQVANALPSPQPQAAQADVQGREQRADVAGRRAGNPRKPRRQRADVDGRSPKQRLADARESIGNQLAFLQLRQEQLVWVNNPAYNAETSKNPNTIAARNELRKVEGQIEILQRIVNGSPEEQLAWLEKLTEDNPQAAAAIASLADRFEATLDSIEAKLKDTPGTMLEGVTGAPVWLTKAALRGVVQVVRVAYRASKDLALALRAGLEWLRDQNLRGFDEAQAHGWLAKTITEGSSVDGLNIRATSDLLAASPLIPDEVRAEIANVAYEVVTDQNAVDFSNRVLDKLGDPASALPILADQSNGLGGKRRTVLAFLTLLRLSQAITQAKAAGDTATVQRLAETEAAVYDYTLADRITDAAQTLQAVSVFSKLSPEGRLVHARRRIQRAGDRDLDPLKAQLNDALKKLEKAKKDLAEETARGREIQEQAAKAIADALEASALQPGTPVGKAIAIHVLGQLRQAGVISAVEAEVMRQHYAATDPSLTLAQKLERANIPQPEKRAKQIEAERTKAIEAERARLKKRVAALGANPNIDALSLDAVDAALLAGMRQLKLNLGKLVREHWSKVERAGKTLAESLVTEGGLTGEAAQKLATAFERRFNQLAQAKLKRELEKVLKPVTRSAIAKPGLVEKLMGLLRLGAFSNEAYWKAVMERLKLPEFSEALRDRLTAIGARLDALPESDIEGRHRVSVDFLNALEQAAGIDPLDLSLGFYITNLLTGIPTHVANTSANFFAAVANAGIQMERAIAEGRYDDIPAAIEAAAVGLKKALPQAGRVMRTGILPATRDGQARASRPMELAQFGTRGGVPLRDTGMVSRGAKWALETYPAKILNLWKLNGRAMAAEDLLAFTPAMEVQRVLLARRVARAEGLRGEALRNRVAGLLADADPTQVEDAREFALRVVNSATPYGLVGAVVNLINQAKGSEHRALRGAANIVAPVLTIPMNAFNESLNYTPVGLWRRRAGVTNLLGRDVKNLSLEQQQDLRAELLAKALTGTLYLTAAALMVAQFLDDDDPALALYGTGPQDMTDNKGWRERGALPHSLKVGNTYFSFALTPIAAPLSALGNWFDRERDVRIYGKKRSDSLATQAGVAILSSLDVLFEQPFMVGFVDLFRLAGNTQGSDETKVRSGFRRAAKTASSFVVPNEVRNIDRYFDPKVYPVRDLEGALVSAVPFVRGMGGKPALNALGQPIESHPFHRFLSQQASDPLIRGLDAKGAWPTVLDDRNKVWPAKRRAMTEGEFYQYQAETGRALDRKLRAEWPAWSRLPDAEAREKVNDAATKERAIWRARHGWGRP